MSDVDELIVAVEQTPITLNTNNNNISIEFNRSDSDSKSESEEKTSSESEPLTKLAVSGIDNSAFINSLALKMEQKFLNSNLDQDEIDMNTLRVVRKNASTRNSSAFKKTPKSQVNKFKMSKSTNNSKKLQTHKKSLSLSSKKARNIISSDSSSDESAEPNPKDSSASSLRYEDQRHHFEPINSKYINILRQNNNFLFENQPDLSTNSLSSMFDYQSNESKLIKSHLSSNQTNQIRPKTIPSNLTVTRHEQVMLQPIVRPSSSSSSSAILPFSMDQLKSVEKLFNKDIYKDINYQKKTFNKLIEQLFNSEELDVQLVYALIKLAKDNCPCLTKLPRSSVNCFPIIRFDMKQVPHFEFHFLGCISILETIKYIDEGIIKMSLMIYKFLEEIVPNYFFSPSTTNTNL